ncbi:scarecrow-like protein 22 [Cucurbita moschata]|uniref:Scarecrow-like protein 22 n=1 Tax=Cucurbita moschata TaxID=3662 RepID=A0A6J1FXA9_CUCMO|nr:scarecrow-like protein 22 [Cucurbita moschata]
MRGIPFQFQGKGELEISAAFSSPICSGFAQKWVKKGEQQQQQQEAEEEQEEGLSYFVLPNNEPTSVLHMRSPSPPTSASTLSSSFGGGGAGGGCVPSFPPETPSVEPLPGAGVGTPIFPGGLERCGVGLEDLESMWTESAGPEQSFLRWIAGDVVEDPSLGIKTVLQNGNIPFDMDSNGSMGIVDQGSEFDPAAAAAAAAAAAGNVLSNINPNLSFPVPAACTGFSDVNGSNNKPFSRTTYKSSCLGLNNRHGNFNVQNPIFSGSVENLVVPVSAMIYPPQLPPFEAPDEKPQNLNAQVLLNQHQQHPQNPSFFVPLAFGQPEQQLQLQLKRHNSSGGVDPNGAIPKVPFMDPGNEMFLRNHQQVLQQQQQLGYPLGLQFLPQQKAMSPKPKVIGHGDDETAYQNPPQQQQQHALLDQLYKAAELVGTGNFSHAQGILARLNHQLSPVGKPLQRAAFYFKEALQLLLLMNNPVNPPPPRCPTPCDVIFKMGAYKVFSEISPLIQFVNFTCNQALLEALDDVDRIHIVDFDIGFGAQWASFMQELSLRNQGAPSLKITAFASPSTHHPIELGLMRDNLTQFANDIGISFEFEVVNFDSLNQNSSLPFSRASENEAIAVNFPLWSSSNQPAMLPSLLRFIKQLSPKIVVSLDRGCDRSDLPFPQHMLQALQSYINLLESLDAINMNSDAINKIERFLLQPRIESTVLGRLRVPERMPLWKTLFASAGYMPVTFSNFTETQAECVAKRTSVRGFHVEKRQASLVFCWQRRELISASAWRC